jgi:hypothetical protein
MPVTTPDAGSIVATDVALLLHVPPVLVVDNEVVLAAHAVVEPVIELGNALTVIVSVAIPEPQELGTE